MMTFQERLAQLKKKVEGNMPPGYVKTIHNTTKRLRESGIQENVLKVDAQIPDFILPNQKGDWVDAKKLYSRGPLAITFYRGFWCSYCNADLANLKKYIPDIQAAGGMLIAISPEQQEYSKKIATIQKLNFDILHDQGNVLAEKFGLKFHLSQEMKALYRDKLHVNLKLYHGDDEWALPMPARFLVDREGVIRYAESEPDYTKRPDPDDLMEVLQHL